MEKINIKDIKNNLHISSELLFKLSEIIDRMEIREELQKLDKSSNEELLAALVTLFITNIYKVKDFIYDYIIEVKELYKETIIIKDENISDIEYEDLISKQKEIDYNNALKQAKKVDIIKFFKNLLTADSKSFL